jgi:hypothetical protein
MNQITKKHKNRNKVNYTKNANKTLKKKSSSPIINNHNKQYYLTNYVNTALLPYTSIIQYINTHYQEYLAAGEKVNKFGFYFDVKDDFISQKTSEKLDQMISKNPSMTLDKLLAYALYSKSNSFFKEKGTLKIEDLKNQIGKDSTRIEILVNGDSYQYPSAEENEFTSNDEKADYFIVTLLDYLSKFGKNINYNLLNQIGIACCQNLFNLMVDQLTVTIMKAIHPETCAFLNGKKHIELLFNDRYQKAKLFFSSNIIISYQELLDPEYTCGQLEFILVLDFTQNTYVFEKFVLNYEIEKCNPVFLEQQQLQEQQKEDKKNKYSFLKKHLMKHAAISVATAIITTPFALGAIGGNKNTKKRIKKKIKKRIKKRKTKKNHS